MSTHLRWVNRKELRRRREVALGEVAEANGYIQDLHRDPVYGPLLRLALSVAEEFRKSRYRRLLTFWQTPVPMTVEQAVRRLYDRLEELPGYVARPELGWHGVACVAHPLSGAEHYVRPWLSRSIYAVQPFPGSCERSR